MPERIGRYLVLRRLGAGAMGVVVVAYDPELDRQIAIKLIHPRVAQRGEARTRMLREAKGMARLSHPNVVQVYDAGTVDGRVFIAMELVDGKPLSTWSQAEARPLDEVLTVFMGAGRGLAAAHDAGLVHRDFKPDNVLVDGEGRARVLDFGLVRATDEGGEARERSGAHAAANAIATEPTLEVSLAHATGLGGGGGGGESVNLMDALLSSELDLELTHGDQIMGTPAYMSPEQWKGGKADARSDQFSFCVALWEAIYGERPFQGRTLQALAQAVSSGRIHESSSAIRLPRRVRAALERGLAVEPDQRFETMDALLRELGREDWSRRSLPLAAVALAVFGLLAWVRFGGASEVVEPSCAGAGERIVEVWSADRQATIAAAFAATGVPSERVMAKVSTEVDAYADRWRSAAVDNCAATNLRKSQSEALLDLRTRCLERRLGELDALLEVLGRADAATIEAAPRALESLPSLDGCSPERVSEVRSREPEDPERAAAVAEARQRLAGARASLDTGRYPEAGGRLDELRATVEALAHAPLEAEFAVEYGRLLARIDRWEEASAELQRAFFLASRLDDLELAVHAAGWLAELEGAQRQRPEFASLWAAQAGALIEREPGRLVGEAADLADTISWNAYLAGDLAGARDEAERGLARLDDAKLDAPMRRMALLLDRGAAEYGLGDLSAAEATFEAALALAETTVGRDNPLATGALNNLSITYSAEGEFERARALLEESVATRERALGLDNSAVGVGLSNLADIELELGHAQAALAAIERGHAILVAGLGPDQYATVIAHQRLGLARALVGRHDDALIDLRETLVVAEAPPDPDPSLAFELRADLAVVLAAAGQLEASEQAVVELLELEPERWRELVSAGRFAVRLGVSDIAKQLLGIALERASEVAVEDVHSRRIRAQASLDLAALWLPEDPARAAATLGPELDADLRGAPRLQAKLAELRAQAE